ncbi:hypothetical protein CDL12_14885 [Handroanthus impetiginosus]|uniref:DUF1232 domain-containing protein n=1 Tax=Handroanthus impetiginosus TaxID=429701 RepID=A0A2G9H4R1_9LAMI|nr:hypothetical protein CDL12_14885 [Handroanthus impetiginosus]
MAFWLLEVPEMFRYIIWLISTAEVLRFSSKEKKKLEHYSLVIGSALYVISPVDIIPEALLGILGFVDDLIIIFICFLHVAALYRAVLVSRHGDSQH